LLGALLVLPWIATIPLCVTLKENSVDKPIAGTQLQQKKLAEMITEITKANC
jgi:hypothetical protein